MRQVLSSEKKCSVVMATGNPLRTCHSGRFNYPHLCSVQKRIKLDGWSLEAFGLIAYTIFRIMKANH
jgi:hypothetical protein